MRIKMPALSRKAWIYTAIGSLLIAGGSAFGISQAMASIPDSSGVIHGCYRTTTGELRVIDSATSSCLGDETSLNWSQGPGTAGPDGLAVTVVDASQGYPSTQAYAECPAGEPYVIGGGGSPSGPSLTASEPWDFTTNTTIGNQTTGSYAETTDQYGWMLRFASTSATPWAYAICSA